MKNLMIQAGKDTPAVSFDINRNVFEIAGESFNQFPMEFYKPVLVWLKQYLPNNQQPITVNISLKYFNTPTYPPLMEILQILEEHQQKQGAKVQVNWFANSNDPDMANDGKFLLADFDHLDVQIKSA